MGCAHSPGLDPGGGDPVPVPDRLASVPGGRGDYLRARSWVAVPQSGYANRQVRPGPDIVAVDGAVRAQHRSGHEGELGFNARAYDYRGCQSISPWYSDYHTHQVSPASDLYV
jgi:hypothetical protein